MHLNYKLWLNLEPHTKIVLAVMYIKIFRSNAWIVYNLDKQF